MVKGPVLSSILLNACVWGTHVPPAQAAAKCHKAVCGSGRSQCTGGKAGTSHACWWSNRGPPEQVNSEKAAELDGGKAEQGGN